MKSRPRFLSSATNRGPVPPKAWAIWSEKIRDWIPGWRATACKRRRTNCSRRVSGSDAAGPCGVSNSSWILSKAADLDLVHVLEMTEDCPIGDADFLGQLGCGELPQTSLPDDLDGGVSDLAASFLGGFPDRHWSPC